MMIKCSYYIHCAFDYIEEPGELMFQEATYHVDYGTGVVTANVIRIHGCDGTVFVSYRTM